MTQEGQLAAAAWQDRDFARDWAHGDMLRNLLDFPRRIATTVVALDSPDAVRVVDIGSGPGDFLAVFLEAFPSAQGTWIDASKAMLELAQERLAPFVGRIDFRLGDMTDLGGAGTPANADVIMTSRASHHLDRRGLLDFYRQAADYLAPGGWLVNLDHARHVGAWEERLRSARMQLVPSPAREPSHHHDQPLPTVQDHLDGYAAADISDVDMPWRAFITCLFMGRRGI